MSVRRARSSQSARARGRDVREARLADHADRGVALHEPRAAAEDRTGARMTRRSASTRRRRWPARAGAGAGVRQRPARRAHRRVSFARSPDEPRIADWERNAMVALNTANQQDGARIEIPAGAVVDGFIHLLFIGNGRRHLVASAQRDRRRREQPGDDRRDVRRHRAATSRTPSRRSWRDEGAVVDHYKVECESRDAFHVGNVFIQQERAANVTSRNVALGGALGAQRDARRAGRRRRVDRARRPLRRHRHAAPRQPHGHRPRPAALREPRAVQGRARRERARRLRRPDHRPSRRAEDRLAPGEPQSAALRDGDRRLQADARDPQRRREVQPRLDDRPDRRRSRCSTSARAASARTRRATSWSTPSPARSSTASRSSRCASRSAARCSRRCPQRLPERRERRSMR